MISTSTKCLAVFILLPLFFLGCGTASDLESSQISESTAAISTPANKSIRDDDTEELTADEIASLKTLQKVDNYPLYVMTYNHEYDAMVTQHDQGQLEGAFACSLFAAFNGPDGSLVGRNFDWQESPALLLFTDPDDGYASVSMVDISYLGYNRFNLDDLDTVEGRRRLLRAPSIPFDGMNEHGLVVTMAAVPNAEIPKYEGKSSIISVTLMRLMLDQAKTVDEAIELVDDFNIDFAGGPNIHYLVADRDGDSAVVELKHRKIHIHRNEEPWQVATNFFLTGVLGDPTASCHRYAELTSQLQASEGKLSTGKAMDALQAVAQPSTRWSILYAMDKLEAHLVVNRNYDKPYVLSLKDQQIEQLENSASAAN